jgi:hypothetical protein
LPRFDKHGDAMLSEAIKKKLAALGIPRERHTFEGLAGYFPPEFKIQQAQLETETIASVLLHLVKHGLIKLPRNHTATEASHHKKS